MDLHAKRAALVANLEQLVGQINHSRGAITVVDELLAEQAAATPQPEPTLGEIDHVPSPYWTDEPAPVEMLPVVYDAPDTDAA